MDAQIKKELKQEIEDTELITRTDLEIDKLDKPEEETGNLGERKLYDLTPEQIGRLRGEVFKYLEAIKADPKRVERVEKWKKFKAQYKGELDDKKSKLEFNLNVPVTQDKVDSLERMAIKAITESDPKFDIQLRPESIRQGMDIAEIARIERAQSEYLDYQLDERINILSPLRRVVHQAALLDAGLMKLPYVFKRKRRVRDEFYSGKKTMSEDGATAVPEGMNAFLSNYPLAQLPGEQGHEQFKKLMMFEDVKFKATYWDTVYDDVKPCFVDLDDFFVRSSCEGYDGLCNEQFYAERTRYTHWEMKKLEANDSMQNVDDCKFTDQEHKETDKDYLIKEHNILEITYWFKLNEGDDEETQIICMFDENNKAFYGAYDYPYDNVEAIYLPFYVKDKKKGFYKGGIAEDLTDSHIAQTAILNLTLNESWNQQITTPIVRLGSRTADQVLSGKWRNGTPLIIGHDEAIKEVLDFVPKQNARSAMELLKLLMFLGRYDDKRTGISGLASGQETPLDPNAPAAKTAMLMKQSGISIEDYINCLLPSVNKMAEIILKLTHQASDSGRKYRHKQKAGAVTGQDLFGSISRDDIMMETVIQSRAAGFAFDRIAEKTENLAIFQLLRNEPLIAQNPKAVHNIVHTMLESWSPTWRAKADKIAMDVGEMDQMIAKVGIKALGTYMNALSQQAKASGAMPQPDIKEYLGITAELLSQMVNPPQQEGEKK